MLLNVNPGVTLLYSQTEKVYIVAPSTFNRQCVRMCVCARACMHACVRACVHACVCGWVGGAATRFMKILLEAKIEDNDVMYFSKSPPWFYAEDECKSLYICKAYKDIEKLLKIHENQPRTTLTVGTPGVGKSFFFQFICCARLSKVVKVFFHCAVRDTVYIFNPNNSLVTTTDKCPPQTILETNTLYMYDADAKHKPMFDSGSSRLIVFTSPSSDNCHGFSKGEGVQSPHGH